MCVRIRRKMARSYGELVVFLKEKKSIYSLSKGKTTVGSSLEAHIRFNHCPGLEPIHCVIDINELGIASITNKCAAKTVKINDSGVKESVVLRNKDMVEVQGKKFQYINDTITNKEIDQYITNSNAFLKRKSAKFTRTPKNANKISLSVKTSPKLKKKLELSNLKPKRRKSESTLYPKIPSSARKAKSSLFATKRSHIPIKSIVHMKSTSILKTSNLGDNNQTKVSSKSHNSSTKNGGTFQDLNYSPIKKNNGLVTVQTPNQTRTSFRSRKSKVQEDENLSPSKSRNDESNHEQSDYQSPDKKIRLSKLVVAIETANQSGMSSRSRKSLVQEKSGLETVEDSPQIEPGRIIEELDYDSSIKDIRLSKSVVSVLTPIQSRMSTSTRKSLLQEKKDSSPIKPRSIFSTIETSRLDRRNIEVLHHQSPVKEIKLSKSFVADQTPIQSRMSSRSRKSLTQEESGLEELEDSSPIKPESTIEELDNESPIKEIRLSKSFVADQTPNQSRMSSRSRKLLIQEESGLEELEDLSPIKPASTIEELDHDSSIKEIRLSKLVVSLQTPNQCRMSTRSRKSLIQEESSLEEVEDSPQIKLGSNIEVLDHDSPIKEIRLSKSVVSIQTPNQSRMSTRSRKSLIQEESSFEEVEDSPEIIPGSNMEVLDHDSPIKEIRLSKSVVSVQTPNQSRMSTRPRKSLIQEESSFKEVEDSPQIKPGRNIEVLDHNSPIKEIRLSKSVVSVQTPNQSRMSTKSHKSLIQEESSFEEVEDSPEIIPGSNLEVLDHGSPIKEIRLSKSDVSVQTPNQSRMSTRPRKSLIQEESSFEEVEDSPQIKPGRNIEVLDHNSPIKEIRLSKSVVSVQTPNQSRMSTKSHKSLIQEESSFEEVEDSPEIIPGSNLEVLDHGSPIKEVRLSKSDVSVQTPNQSRMSTRPRKSLIQEESSFEEVEDSPQIKPGRNIEVLDHNSPVKEFRLSKSVVSVQTPNQSRMSTKSRKSLIQEENSFEEVEELSPIKPGSNIDELGHDSPIKEIRLSKLSPIRPRSRICSTIYASRLHDKSILEELDLPSPVKETSLSKSVVPVQTPSQSRMSSRSRKSLVQEESSFEEVKDLSPIKSDKTLSYSILSKGSSTDLEVTFTLQNDNTFEDSDVFSSTKSEGNISHSLALDKTPSQNRSFLFQKSRGNILEIDDDLSPTELDEFSQSTFMKSRKSSIQQNGIENIENEFSPTEADVTPNMNRRSSRAYTPVKADKSNIEYTNVFSPKKPETVSRLSLKSPRTRKSKTEDNNLKDAFSTRKSVQWSTNLISNNQIPEQNVSIKEQMILQIVDDIPSPIQLDVRIANSLLSTSQSVKSRRTFLRTPLKSETNETTDYLDSSSNDRNSESLSKLERPNRTRWSRRIRKSAFSDDFDYSCTNPSYSVISEASRTQIHDYSVNEESMYPLGKSRNSIYSFGLMNNLSTEESILEKRNSEFVSKRRRYNIPAVNNTNDIGNDSKNTTFESFRPSERRSTRNCNNSERVSVITVNDSIEEDQEPSEDSNSVSKSFPYQPITEDITPARTDDEVQNSRKNDSTNISGVKNLFAGKSSLNDLTEVQNLRSRLSPRIIKEPNDITDVHGVKQLMKTPKTVKEPLNDLSDVRGLRKLLQTPKIPKEPLNDLSDVRGIKKLMKTPKTPKEPLNDLSDVHGIKKLMKTPEIPKEPLNDLRDVRGIKKLMKTPEIPKEPLNDLSDVHGIKKLMKTPKIPKEPLNDLRDVRGIKKLMKTPKTAKEPLNDLSDVRGIKKLMKTPEIPKEPLNDLSDVHGIKKLMKTPKTPKEPLNDLSDVHGIKKLMKTPKTVKEPLNDLSDVSGIKNLMKNPETPKENNEELFAKIFDRKPLKTYRSKSLGSSPAKKIKVADARKSFYDKSCISPRVEEWIEQQAAIRQKTEEVFQTAENISSKPQRTLRKRKAQEAEDVEYKNTRSTRRKPEIIATEIPKIPKQELISAEEHTPKLNTKKKVKYLDEVMYFPITPDSTRKLRSKGQQLEAEVKSKKLATEEKENKPARSTRSRGKNKKEEEEETIDKIKTSKPKRGKKSELCSEISDNILRDKEQRVTRSTKTENSKSSRGKKLENDKEIEHDNVILEDGTKSNKIKSRGKKQENCKEIEHEKVILEDVSKSKKIKSSRDKNQDNDKEIELEKVITEDVTKSKKTRSLRGKNQDNDKEIELEQVIPEDVTKSKKTRSLRGKKQENDKEIELEKVIPEDVTKSKKTKSSRGKKQENDKEIGQEKVIPEDATKSKKTKSSRGKKQENYKEIEQENDNEIEQEKVILLDVTKSEKIKTGGKNGISSEEEKPSTRSKRVKKEEFSKETEEKKELQSKQTSPIKTRSGRRLRK